MAQQIQLRHDTAANWTSANPTLMIGEYGYETDTQKHKIGDGVTAWASLAYSPVDPSLLSSAVPISKGGTGQTTQAAAIDALTGTQGAGKYLRSDGTHATLSTIQAADVPTLNQNTTGSAGTASTATAPVTGSAHGAVTLDVSGHFQSVAPGVAGGYLRSNGTDFVRSTIQGSDVPTLNQSTTGNAATATSPAAGTGHGAVTLSSLGAFQSVAPGNSGNTLQSNGTDWVSAAPAATTYTAPTVQKFTSGSGTYTRPTPAPLYIRVRMVGGGGGGGGSGNTVGATAGSGGNTTFGTTLLSAGGGAGGSGGNANGGAGGSASLGTGPIGIALAGATGQGGSNTVATGQYAFGAMGASSPLGGAGPGGAGATTGGTANTNTGSGGGGGGAAGTGAGGGSGGGAGGFVDAIITSPASTYAYAVGGGGTAAGGVTANGGAGAAGIIEVTEFYQ